MFFVYFDDEETTHESHGIVAFNDEQKATDFIKRRMNELNSNKSCYTVICGRVLDFDVVRKVDTVSIK